MAVKIVDPSRSEPLPPNHEGLLLVKGPNRMLRLSGPAGTDGRSADRRLVQYRRYRGHRRRRLPRITDRLSRFSKIGGEMVPHLKVEEAVYGVIGDASCR